MGEVDVDSEPDASCWLVLAFSISGESGALTVGFFNSRNWGVLAPEHFSSMRGNSEFPSSNFFILSTFSGYFQCVERHTLDRRDELFLKSTLVCGTTKND